MMHRLKAATDQWNVPDWRDASLYPVPQPESDNSDLPQWRWEFLRRDKEYRQDWLRIRAIDPEGKLALLADSPRHLDWEVPVLVKEQHQNPFYFQKKYKLKRLFNPAHRKPAQLAFYPLPSNSITMVFDLDKPISTQVARAEQVLEKYQKAFRGVISRANYPDKKKWPLFLRAIDAQDQRVPLSKIGYKLLSMDKERHDLNQAKAYAASFLEIGRRFWKKLGFPPDKS
ncbi:MAG: hypothetical protein ABIU05_13635 [Nitrospirales bacterium]